MSSACSKLRRILQTQRLPARPTTATASSTGKPRRHPPAVDELFKEPNVDELARKFKQKSASFYFRSKTGVYSYALNRLLRHKRFSAIEDILEAHKKYDDITREGYAARLITLYGDTGMFEHAQNLFEELPELKCERTTLSFNSLLGAALHCNEFDRVIQLFRLYRAELGLGPNVCTYNTVIGALGELGLVEEAISMVDEMEMKGLKPDTVTLASLLVGIYGKCGFSEGEKVWDLMLDKTGCSAPDIKCYNAKLQGMVGEGLISEAIDLFHELRIKGLDPNATTYNHLIKGLCDNGDLEEAKKWYGKLLDSGYFPNGNTFNILTRVLCENGDCDMALDLSKRMLRRYFVVDQDLLQMVVDYLVKESKVEEAKNFVELASSNLYYQYNLVMPLES